MTFTHILSDVYGVLLTEAGLNQPYVTWLNQQKGQGAHIAFGSNVSEEMAGKIIKKYQLNQISNQFFSSGKLGIKKPDLAFFHTIETYWPVPDPTTALFIDDTPANTAAAQTCGWQTYTYCTWDAFQRKYAA